METRHEQRSRLSAVGLSLIVAVALMTVKFWAWHLTGSSAILSDALESIINVIAGGFALISVWIAERPPDESHPYGHGKIEYFSAGFEGAMIVLAALSIFYAGGQRIVNPQPIPHFESGLLLLLGAALVNSLLGIFLLRIGRRTRSLTLEADGRHVLTDVYTSAGVLAGLLVVKVTGQYRLDGLVACLMGVQILATGYRLVRKAVSGLMDETDTALIDQLAEELETHRRLLWIDIHEMRCRRAGRMVHISLHLILPRDLSLEAAHDEAKHLERLLADFLKDPTSIVIHMDPCLEIDCAACLREACRLRASPDQRPLPRWTRHHLMARAAGQSQQPQPEERR